MQPVSTQALEATRSLLDRVAAREPGAIRFQRTPYDEQKLAFYLANQSYPTILYHYGPTFLLGLLHLYEEGEKYEDCQLIVQAIQNLNALCQMNLPTR